MNIFLRCGFIGIFFLSAVANARADEQALAGLVKVLAAVNSYKAEFEQHIVSNQGKSLQDLKGELVVEKPGKLYWQSREPMAQRVISNGTKVWVYDEDLEQVTVKPFTGEISQTPALLLSGNTQDIAKSFTVEALTGKDEKGYLLTPSNKKNLFSSLRVLVESGVVRRLVMTDNLGQQTDIRFTSIKINQPVAGTLFDFTPPPGVDVLTDE